MTLGLLISRMLVFSPVRRVVGDVWGEIGQPLASGLVFSSIVILGSVGLALAYSISEFPSFAHGDLMTIGAYAALTVNVIAGLPLALGLVVGMVIAGGVAVATHWAVFRPLEGRTIELLISSIGVAFIYRAAIIIRFGSSAESYDVGGRRGIDVIDDAVGVSVTPRGVVTIAATVLLVTALHVTLQYTSLGRMMRATAANKDLARVSGIRTERVLTAMWLIGGALAGAAGVFLGLDLLIRPRVGFSILIVLFAAVILGGIGSVYGAMLGGIVIGMAYELTPLLPFISSEYKTVVAFVILIAVLLVRPTGIVGGKSTA